MSSEKSARCPRPPWKKWQLRLSRSNASSTSQRPSPARTASSEFADFVPAAVIVSPPNVWPPSSYFTQKLSDTAGSPPIHCFPSSFSVDMPPKDVRGLEMVAAPQDKSTMLAVEVSSSCPLQRKSYTDRLRTCCSSAVLQDLGHPSREYGSPVHPPLSCHRLPPRTRKGRGRVQCASRARPEQCYPQGKDRSVSSPASNLFPVLFTADVPVRVVRVPITASTKTSEIEISVGSFLALPFFGILALIFLNQVSLLPGLSILPLQSKAMEVVQNIYSQINRSSSTDRKKRRV